ncbi:MAG: hypothetical protein FGM55_16025, partial [Rhodoferax sp.]|nr:hypothetical protein [Rhodoferax sp.]
MPAQIPTGSSAATVVFMQQALFGVAASNAVYSAALAEVNSAGASAYALSLGNNFASTTDAALASSVLTNLGVTATTIPAASYTVLLDALTQAFAANPTARGQVVLNVSKILATLESDATFGAAATAFNNATVSNLTYSTNTANTSNQTVNPATQSTVGQTFTLTVGADNFTGTAGNDTFTAADTTATTWTVGDAVDGGAGTDTLNI